MLVFLGWFIPTFFSRKSGSVPPGDNLYLLLVYFIVVPFCAGALVRSRWAFATVPVPLLFGSGIWFFTSCRDCGRYGEGEIPAIYILLIVLVLIGIIAEFGAATGILITMYRRRSK